MAKSACTRAQNKAYDGCARSRILVSSATLKSSPPENAMNISLTINGKSYSQDVEPRLLLVHFLRDVAGLTGTHTGCETSLCGACTVELNGKAIKSCTMFAVQANGAEIVTVEGLASDGKLDLIPESFLHGIELSIA